MLNDGHPKISDPNTWILEMLFYKEKGVSVEVVK